MATRFVGGIPKLSSMQGGPISFDWIHKMPLEMAFLLDQPSPDHMGVILFIRQNPTGESIENLINSSSFLHDLRPIQFPGSNIMNDSGGKLRAEGILNIPTEYQELVAKMWSGYQPLDRPTIKGNHFIDVGINNRAGVLAEMHGACMELVMPWADMQLQQNLTAAYRTILDVRLTGDLIRADELGFNLSVDCTDSGSASGLLTAVQAASDALGAYLTARHGFIFSGTTTINGIKIIGTYSLTGFEPKLRRALGGG